MEKILVINNDIDTMTLLKQLLERKSFHVKYTSSGEGSIQIAKKFVPDVVLIDVLQKEWVAKLKNYPATASIPIILMTGYSWNEQTTETVDDVIEKPFFFEELQRKIRTTIANRASSKILKN